MGVGWFSIVSNTCSIVLDIHKKVPRRMIFGINDRGVALLVATNQLGQVAAEGGGEG